MLSELTRVLLALWILSSVACQESEWRSLLPEGKASLVVVFQPGLTQEEINDFLDKEIQLEASDGGEWLRPGVDALVKTSVGGYPAYAVALDPSATPEQRETIREGVKNSPYVYRVFENVAPEDIDLGEAWPPEGEDQNEAESPAE